MTVLEPELKLNMDNRMKDLVTHPAFHHVITESTILAKELLELLVTAHVDMEADRSQKLQAACLVLLERWNEYRALQRAFGRRSGEYKVECVNGRFRTSSDLSLEASREFLEYLGQVHAVLQHVYELGQEQNTFKRAMFAIHADFTAVSFMYGEYYSDLAPRVGRAQREIERQP